MNREIFLESLKRFLGIEQDDTSQDNLLIAYINTAIQTCEEYLGRSLDGGDFTEIIADVSDTIIVTNWPINSVDSIVDIDGNSINMDMVGWSQRRNIIRRFDCASVGYKICAVTVSYNAGYYDDEIPAWLMVSVDYIAASLYNMAGQGQSITSESTGAVKKIVVPGVFTEEYDTGGSESGGVDSGSGSFGIIPDVARQQLDFYRDKRIG